MSPSPDLAASTPPRRLAVILAADITGYSRLMRIDEEGTVGRVTRQLQDVAGPIVRRHNGRIFKTMGDGFLATFESPVEATVCALDFQKAVAVENVALPTERWLRYRVGINLSDVIAAADDLYGDSVNIAARLQTLAEPGGICISGSVHDQIKNKLAVDFLSLGEERLKNIADPVRVFRVRVGAADLVPRPATRAALPVALAGLALVAAGAGWWWLGSPGGPAAQVAGSTGAPVVADVTSNASSSVPAVTDQHREIVFQRMISVMSSNRFSWRTVERVALEAGVSEAEAHDILAAHPHDVVLGRSKDGKVIVRLVDH